MKMISVTIVVLVLSAAVSNLAMAQSVTQTAHFWLSQCDIPSGSFPPGASPIGSLPDLPSHVPLISHDVGAPNQQLHIWGRSAPGESLANLSLNLVAEQAGVINFVNGPMGIVVYNPTVGEIGGASVHRYQHHGSGLVSPLSDRIIGMQGFTIGIDDFGDPPSEDYVGLSSSHCDGDPFCYAVADDTHDWLIASVTYEMAAAGATDLYLQIGSNGMSHAGVPSTGTLART